MAEAGRATATRTYHGLFCPECGTMAVASKYGYRVIANERRVPEDFDTHWCATKGCTHEFKKGEPFGSGLPYG